MKRVLLLLCALMFVCTACAPRDPYEAEFTELGIPLKDVYPDGGVERTAWGIEYYDGALYVGSGDYDTNRGPVNMAHYDLAKSEWKIDGLADDEQIERFYNFDGTLYAVGYDSRSSWDFGNYYTCTEMGRWKTHRTLPNGVHNFDMIMFEGKLFAGLGVEEGNAPIVMTTDQETWVPMYLWKDGSLRKTHGGTYIRVYDFFVLNGTLYASFFLSSDVEKAREIYMYDGNKFVYHSDMPTKLSYAKRSKYVYLNEKVEFKGVEYMTTGDLYKTTDMITAERVDLGETVEVADLRIIGDELYILCNEEIESDDGDVSFRVSVKKSDDGNEFRELFYFEYPVRAMSFTHNNKTFYFGMGNGAADKGCYEENGMVLSVKY